MPFANIKIPSGLLDEGEKRDLTSAIAEVLAATFGDGSRATTMVLIEDVPEGGYYRAGETISGEAIRLRSGRPRIERGATHG